MTALIPNADQAAIAAYGAAYDLGDEAAAVQWRYDGEDERAKFRAIADAAVRAGACPHGDLAAAEPKTTIDITGEVLTAAVQGKRILLQLGGGNEPKPAPELERLRAALAEIAEIGRQSPDTDGDVLEIAVKALGRDQ